MVNQVPIGKSWDETRALELGIDLGARVPANGLLGMRCVVVDALPDQSEMLNNVLYFVREVLTP